MKNRLTGFAALLGIAFLGGVVVKMGAPENQQVQDLKIKNENGEVAHAISVLPEENQELDLSGIDVISVGTGDRVAESCSENFLQGTKGR